MNDSKRKRLREQVKRFVGRFVHSVEKTFADVLPAELVTQWISEEVGPHRERVYGPLSTVKLFVEQVLSADQCCRNAVAREASARAARDEAENSVNTGPYCKARKRLSLGLLVRFGREVGGRLCACEPAVWRWRHRAVKLVDGATVSMPDSKENQNCFPQNREQKAGLGFPLARVVAIVSLSCGAVLEWSVGACEGKETGETALMWQLAGRLSAGDVLIADRCYTSYFMMALLTLLGVDVVMRQHQQRHTDFRRGKRLGKRDHVVAWSRPKRPAWMDEATYASMPATLTLREASAGGWTLVTTLLDAKQVSKLELRELYGMRWKIELDFCSIKAVMQMDILRCQSPEMVKKEIAVHLLAYNLVRTVMAQAACVANVLPRQLSFKGALQMVNAFADNLQRYSGEQLSTQYGRLLTGIAQMKLPYRPGRVEPRAVKRRPKPHKLMTQPRHILREQLRKSQERLRETSLR
jgi:hypothetical protein